MYWLTILVLTASGVLAARRTRAWRGGPALSLVLLWFLILGLEVGCRLMLVRSEAMGVTLAHKSWKRRYWVPINSLGYRDEEWVPAEGKRYDVLVVGDSFAAGAGIRSISDRFTGRLADFLGEGYSVRTAAVPGWQTPDETEALRSYPHTPDLVVLSYFINDIQTAAIACGWPRTDRPPEPPAAIGWLVRRSHLANWIYYRLEPEVVRTARAHYLDSLLNAYADPTVFERHRQELAGFCSTARARGAPVVAVLFPSLVEPERTAPITRRVAAVLRELGATVIDLAPQLTDIDPSLLVVSPVDGHPSPWLHERVARELREAITLLRPPPSRSSREGVERGPEEPR